MCAFKPNCRSAREEDEVASHDGSAVCCVGMWNRGVWAVEKLVVWCVCVNFGVGVFEAVCVNCGVGVFEAVC